MAMADLPRLTVTQEQAKSIHVGVGGLGASRCVLRLPERPTMPCPQVGMEVPDEKCSECDGTGWVPIPEGTRVEVGWWGLDAGRPLADPNDWHPVATATVTEVTKHITVNMDDDVLGEWTWLVTLTDIEEAQP